MIRRPTIGLPHPEAGPHVSILHAIVLGIVQGLTEFLPISSSGHLILVPDLLRWNDFAGDAALNKAFDVALHLGTLVGACWYFRRDLARYLAAAARSVTRRDLSETDARLAWLLLLSAVPGAIVGALLSSTIDEHLGKPVLIGVMMIVGGGVLWWADRRSGERTLEDYRLRDAMLTGCAQVLALNPGTSRSGITISMARVVGFSRDAAARISFMMSIPVIAAAVVLQLGSLAKDGIPDGLGSALVVGIVASGISGWFAMWSMIKLLRTRRFTGFVVYRVAVGVGVLVLLATSVR